MSKKTEGRRFAESFILFVLIEIILYTIIVYLDFMGLNVESKNPRKNPAIMSFFGISSIIFMFFIVRADKKPKK